VLYGCDTGTWRMYDIRVLRRISESRGWRRLRSEELCKFYSSPNVIRVMIKRDEMGGACSMHGI
jgi:hypothetical protein